MTATAAIGTASVTGMGAEADSGDVHANPSHKHSVQTPYDAKGVQTRVLGKTGVAIPIIVFGGGSRFCAVKDPQQSQELLNHALDHGFYYWDTASIYVYDNVCSEERYGQVLKDRRKEVFLATKLAARNYDGAMRQLETSLKRLQTDRVDLLQIHSILSLEDVKEIGAQDGPLRALLKARDEKITRFIGFTGHTSGEAMAAMAKTYDFDTMLIALNHYSGMTGDSEDHAIPIAAKKKMGILAMKAIRPRETVKDLHPEDLIRYALSLPHVTTAAVGTDSMGVLKKNIALAKNFKPLSPEEMAKFSKGLAPFYQSRDLEWMQPSYIDGTV
jgi:aryl-alcohol dehydrogenase-like predicted oxidoreductase